MSFVNLKITAVLVFAAVSSSTFANNDRKEPPHLALTPALDQSESEGRDATVKFQDHQFTFVYADTTRVCALNGDQFVIPLKTEVQMAPTYSLASMAEIESWKRDEDLGLKKHVRTHGIYPTVDFAIRLKNIRNYFKNAGTQTRWDMRYQAMEAVQNKIESLELLQYDLLAGKGDSDVKNLLSALSKDLSYKFGVEIRISMAAPIRLEPQSICWNAWSFAPTAYTAGQTMKIR